MNRELPRQKFYLDEHGRELPDPTPIAPPVGFRRQPSLAEQIRAMVRSERLRQEAEAQGFETFEEADDFEVGDDYDPTSPYEEVFDPHPNPEGAAMTPPDAAAGAKGPSGSPTATSDSSPPAPPKGASAPPTSGADTSGQA